MRRLIPIAAIIVLLVAACGDGDDASPADNDSTPGTAALPSPTAAVASSPTPAGGNTPFVGVNYFWAGATGDNPLCDNDDIDVDVAFARLAGAGVGAVRFWAFQGFAPWKGDDHDWTALDRVFDAAERHGLPLIPVLGNHFGHCDHPFSPQEPPNKNCAWYRSGFRQPHAGYQRSYAEWVEAAVTRYADRPQVMVWELVNEPFGATECVHDFFVEMLALVRSIDPETPRSLGGNGAGGWDFRTENSLPDVTWTTIHNYDTDNDPAQYVDMHERIGRHIAWAREIGKPIYMGEEGIDCTYGDQAARGGLLRRKMDAFFGAGEGTAIGYVLWGYDPDDDASICMGDYDHGFGESSPAIMDLFRRDPLETTP